MKFFSSSSNTPKVRSSDSELMPKDAITLSDGKPAGAFLESALDLLSSQQPVWIPSAQELAELHQQQAMLSMMAAIRQGEHQKNGDSTATPGSAADNVLLAMKQAAEQKRDIEINVDIDKEFINLDRVGGNDGDMRVTIGVASRAIFAKSQMSARKFGVPVACFVASIKENQLGMVFHCSANGAPPVNVELGRVTQCRLTEAHIQLLTEQLGMHEHQARVFAAAIALQGLGYLETITSGAIQTIASAYRVDYEGMVRLGINIEKWRVMRLQSFS